MGSSSSIFNDISSVISSNVWQCSWAVNHDTLVKLKGQDEQCSKLIKLLKENKMPSRKPYFLRKDVLHRIVKEDTFDYEVIVLSKALIGHVLMEAHNNLGHNGIQHTYIP